MRFDARLNSPSAAGIFHRPIVWFFGVICVERIMLSHYDEKSRLRQIMGDARENWTNILSAAEASQEQSAKISKLLDDPELPLGNEDGSFVVFGSLARQEWTRGSDVDWTLLIDGQADPNHIHAAHKFRKRLDSNGFPPPGAAGVFGNLSFSHEIIHQIGGQSDSNRNTTQRVLLLLESAPLGTHGEAFERVIRQVLNRYLADDPTNRKLPRFLLNDIIRFWRTVAVDFAGKQRDRGGKGWGLRNAKLRMSRKLVFTAGMLQCFGAQLSASAKGETPGTRPVLDYLLESVRTTPLETVAAACTGLEKDGNAIGKTIFSNYDKFLGILNDEEKRRSLENLEAGKSTDDPIFRDIRDIGDKFQLGLIALLFSDKYAKLTKEYGVF